MSSLRSLVVAMAALSAACEQPPTSPSQTDFDASVIIEGNFATAGAARLCYEKQSFWPWLSVTTTAPVQTVEVVAYRDIEPGCATTRSSPQTLRAYTYYNAPNESFILSDALTRDCGRVEFVITVNHKPRAAVTVDMARRCEGE